MSYRLVTGTLDAFEERIAGLILEGWEPLGGVSMAFDEHGMEHFAQAMTRSISGTSE